MLNIVRVISPYSDKVERTAEELFKLNRSFLFVIEAPILWWIDVDYGIKYGFDLSPFSKNQISEMPLFTNVGAMLSLTYQEIVEICEDYKCGSFKYEEKYYQWPNEREWNDFCETLLDIKGIRDLVEEEV